MEAEMTWVLLQQLAHAVDNLFPKASLWHVVSQRYELWGVHLVENTLYKLQC